MKLTDSLRRNLTAEWIVLEDAADLRMDWQVLERDCPANVFLSWFWISGWLEEIVQQRPKVVFRVRHQRKIVALGCFAEQYERRTLGLIQSQQYCLHDFTNTNTSLVQEYNGLLTCPGYELEVVLALFESLAEFPLDVDELVLPAMAMPDLDLGTVTVAGWWLCVDKNETARKARLSELCSGSGLSSNARYQIGKSLRDYQKNFQSDVSIAIAATSAEASDMFLELEKLHTRYWVSKGDVGAFGYPDWTRFQQRVIRQGVEEGYVQMVKITVASHTIGCLYNLISGKQILNIQSGFDYDLLPKSRPGYVSHWLAAKYNYAKGYEYYNLLMGDMRYKRSLCRESDVLKWLVITRRNAKFATERLLQKVLSRR